jgi:DNA-binding response OmpR family regulator
MDEGAWYAQQECMADVLIVDDSPDLRTLLAVFVGMAGHAVREAGDGRQGLDAIAERTPDLVLLDVEMPVLTGPEMAYQLFLRDCGDENIPVILLSGVVGLRDVAAMVGTPYFLKKPYSLEALNEMVDRALREQIPPRPRLAA